MIPLGAVRTAGHKMAVVYVSVGGGIYYGASINDRRLGWTQRVANPCATEPVSIHTLRHLLVMTARLWACPEYKHVDCSSQSHSVNANQLRI